jgi:hypothetical protein
MTIAKLAASMAAFLLSSTALMAQEAQPASFQSVFIDVGGTAVLVPMDVALEACNLDETGLQSAFQSRLDESGIDQTQFTAQMQAAMDMTGQAGAAGTGDAATQDTAAADAGAASGTEGAASADAGGATDAAGTTGGAAATDTSTAEASNAAAGDVSGAAAGTETTDTAAGDASGAAGQDAAGSGTGDVQNVETTAANTTGDAGTMGAADADPFIQLAACQIDQARATELQVDMSQTGSSLGFDAAALGMQSGAASQ